jgi:hypothetical protein
MAVRSHNDPMKHKSGKPRLGPLNVKQLEDLLKNARNKHKPKIQRALNNRIKTQSVAKVAE